MSDGDTIWLALAVAAAIVEWRWPQRGVRALVRLTGRSKLGWLVLALAWAYLGTHLFTRIGVPLG